MYLTHVNISGLDFTSEIIDRIQGEIDAHPEVSRVRLSRAVCGILNWRSTTGKLKEMSCRVALLKLQKSGKLRLPAAHPFRNTLHRPIMKRADPAQWGDTSEAPLSCSLRSIRPIKLECITSASTKASREWNAIMRRYHYLGSGPLCGAQVRYLIRAGNGNVLGGLSFSAAAFTLSCRDRRIGWSNAARKENLHRIVCNSRFLILPYINVPHLASHVLGMLTHCIGTDWQQRYGYEPVMLETFVDPKRFRGTSYRAANWEYVGKTTGRSRQDRNSTLNVGEKDVYIIPLCADAHKILCTSTLCKTDAEDTPYVKNTQPADWAAEEFGEADLGDRRLDKRLVTLARDFWAQPQSNIPQACKKRSAMKAAYRFFENESVTMEKLLIPHYQATLARIRATPPVVLAVQDTTELNYATHPKTEGLGPVSTNKNGAVGLFVHDTLAITPQGVPLGLIDVQCWARDITEFGKRELRHSLPIEEKESNKWLVSYEAASNVQRQCPAIMVVSVGDRESDVYELFVKARDTHNGAHLLVRARQSRKLAEEHENLWETLRQKSPASVTEVIIPRHGDRPARNASLEVRFMKAVLSPPPDKRKLGNVTLWVVTAREINAPKGMEPVEWLLHTTKVVADTADALEVLGWYSRRWGIEVYHRTLKSGCKIERRQLGSADKLEACLAIDMVIAWRIYYLTKMGRETPDVSCTVFFDDYEWKALVTHVNHTAVLPEKPPRLREAVRMVASLGGFIGRNGDGEPGTQTTWLGLQCLDGISLMFKYMAETYAPHLLDPSVLYKSTYG